MDTQDANIHIHKVNPKEVRVEVVANASGVRNAQGKWRGGQYCSAVDCHNCTYRDGPRGVKFFRYPTNPTMKERWIKQVNRKKPNGSPWSPGPNARLCSEHFVSGKWSKDPENPDYEPSIFPTSHVKERKPADLARFERRKRRHDCSSDGGGKISRLNLLEDPHDEVTLNTGFLVAAEVECDEGALEGAALEEGTDDQAHRGLNLNDSFASLENSFIFSDTDKDISGSTTDTADETCCTVPKDKKPPVKLDYSTQTPKAHEPRSRGCQTEKKITVNRATNTDRVKRKSNALPILTFPDLQHFAFTGTHKPTFQFLLYRIGDKLIDDPRSLKREDKLALVLVKLKMNVRFVNLAAMFDINKNSVSMCSLFMTLLNTVFDRKCLKK